MSLKFCSFRSFSKCGLSTGQAIALLGLFTLGKFWSFSLHVPAENFVFLPNTFLYFKYFASINAVKQTLSKFSVLIMLVLVSAALGLPALPLDGMSCLEDADEGVEKLGL